MVLLTMTPSVVEGLKKLDETHQKTDEAESQGETQDAQSEPSLRDPAVGKPISHGQIVELWRNLQASQINDASSCGLEQLLRGSFVYVPPPPPKPEPTAQYKALMARLRRDEEARSYERMVNPPPRLETFHDRFPYASSASAFAEVNRPTTAADMGDDEVTYNDVHRQLTLVFNFIVSILGVAATLWIAARWWTVSARLFLTLGGSILVAVAEVAVYSGYVWRMGEAKQKQDKEREVKEVVQTWVVGEDDTAEKSEGTEDQAVLIQSKEGDGDGALRKRNTAAKVVETGDTSS